MDVKAPRKPLRERILDAETRGSRWFADGNAAREAGDTAKADECYAKAQYWLDSCRVVRIGLRRSNRTRRLWRSNNPSDSGKAGGHLCPTSIPGSHRLPYRRSLPPRPAPLCPTIGLARQFLRRQHHVAHRPENVRFPIVLDVSDKANHLYPPAGNTSQPRELRAIGAEKASLRFERIVSR